MTNLIKEQQIPTAPGGEVWAVKHVEERGETADVATNRIPSRAAPASEVLKGRDNSAQGKLGTSAALGRDPKDNFALKGQQQGLTVLIVQKFRVEKGGKQWKRVEIDQIFR